MKRVSLRVHLHPVPNGRSSMTGTACRGTQRHGIRGIYGERQHVNVVQSLRVRRPRLRTGLRHARPLGPDEGELSGEPACFRSAMVPTTASRSLS